MRTERVNAVPVPPPAHKLSCLAFCFWTGLWCVLHFENNYVSLGYNFSSELSSPSNIIHPSPYPNRVRLSRIAITMWDPSKYDQNSQTNTNLLTHQDWCPPSTISITISSIYLFGFSIFSRYKLIRHTNSCKWKTLKLQTKINLWERNT